VVVGDGVGAVVVGDGVGDGVGAVVVGDGVGLGVGAVVVGDGVGAALRQSVVPWHLLLIIAFNRSAVRLHEDTTVEPSVRGVHAPQVISH